MDARGKAEAVAQTAAAPKPRVVILGGGFGGLSAAIALGKADADIVLIDRRNHHLFQPLLYQVATAALNPSDIAQPIRGILRGQKNTTVLLGEVEAVDRAARTVTLRGGRVLGYDWLVVATGARHGYFGHPEWEAFAPGLKELDDATAIRRRILSAFEKAEDAMDEAERTRLLTFVIVGAGPTGVEMAGAIAELARQALPMDFRRINSASARIILADAAPRVLPAFPEELSAKAAKQLQALGVELRLGAAVSACAADHVVIDGGALPTRTILWAAGVAASPAARWLGVAADRTGRVVVDAQLHPEGDRHVFVVGDTASVAGPEGRPLPGIAPVAKQQGAWAGRAIAAAIAGRLPAARFDYKHAGFMATIGRGAAVADFGKVRLAGFTAWMLWGVAHVYFLIGFRNRMSVALSWAWAYATFQRGARLITGSEM
jgi:NADH dehydrogenase